MSSLGYEASADLKPKLEMWADCCESLWATWNEFSTQFSGGPKDGSPFRSDLEAFTASHPDADTTIANVAGDLAARLTGAMGQHVSALAVLLRTGVVTLSVYPAVRAELELAGTSAWLLEPGTPSDPLGTDSRVARGLMFALSDTRDHLKSKSYAKSALITLLQAAESKILAQIDSVFPGSALTGDPPRSWELGGEKYPSTNKMLDLFSSLAFTNSPSVYGFYSRFSHPSIITLDLLSKKTRTDSTVRVDYHVPSEVIEDWVRMATISFHKASHLVARYFGFDTLMLDQWDQSAPDHWFDTGGAA